MPRVQKWWAGNQGNLGAAYVDRVRGDKPDNLEKAKNYYQVPQKVFTRKDYPQEWAALRTNQGIIYRQQGNIESAIAAHQDAVNVLNDPEKLGKALRNLGATCLDDNIGNEFENAIEQEAIQVEYATKAINCLEKALEICQNHNFDDFGELEGSVQMNLAGAYKKTGNHRKAIDEYIKSLSFYSREDFPEKWAKNYLNLGKVYSELQQNDNAVRCYKLSLSVFTPSNFPIYCCEAGARLGNIAFEEKQWEVAIEGYTVTIEAIETSRSWASKEERRQEIFEKAFFIYQKMVQACIKARKLEKALETIERSRSKYLYDLIIANQNYSDKELPIGVKKLRNQYENLQQQIEKERCSNMTGSRQELLGTQNSTFNYIALQSSQRKIISWGEKQQELLQKIRREQYPLLAAGKQVRRLEVSQMQKLVEQPTTAILSFYLIQNDIHIFILRQNKISLHTCTIKEEESAYQ